MAAVMSVYPFSDRPSAPWVAFCRLCDRVIRNKTYRNKSVARTAAARHLLRHRAEPGFRLGTYQEPTKRTPSRKEIIAEMTRGKAKCPTPTKRQHISEAEANEHIKLLEAAGRGNPDYNAYKCWCGVWHVGHSQVSLQKRIRIATKEGSRNARRKRRAR